MPVQQHNYLQNSNRPNNSLQTGPLLTAVVKCEADFLGASARDVKVSRPIFSVSVSKAVVLVSMFLVSVSRDSVGLVAGNARIF